MMSALAFLVFFPLSTATAPGLSSLRSFTYDGGAGQGMDGSGTMMDMAAHIMGMPVQAGGNPPGRHPPLDTAANVMDNTPTLGGATGPGQSPLDTADNMGQGGWTSLSGMHLPHGPAAPMMDRPPPPPPLMGRASPQGEMGGRPPPGGSSQLHIMEKLNGPSKASRVPTTTVEKFSPVGVAADYTYFASKLAGSGRNGPDPLDYHAVPISDIGHMLLETHGSRTRPAKDLHYHDTMPGQGSPPSHHPPKLALMSNNRGRPAKGSTNMQSRQVPGLKPSPNLRPHQQQQGQKLLPRAPPSLPNPIGPPSAEQLLMSNLFAMGLDKAGDHKQIVPEPLVTASKTRGLTPIPGLTAPIHTNPAASNTANMALRAPCDLLVDAVFALDDMKNLWIARESIRYYETQLLPSRKTRFGVVLCGQQKSFYTALHQHFSALLASLEDLQHANATLDPAQHMPDTPGHRSDNNPYPPRVSEDFAQIDTGCLETSYHLLTYQSPPNVHRLLTLVGTKERWANSVSVEEARFLHSLNISLLSMADGDLSSRAQDSLRKMASSPDKFRSVVDNVTLHALPAMIGSAICRPQKADVTVAIQRTSIGNIQQPVVTGCRQVDPISMMKTMDFGIFGYHTDRVRCPPGLVPDTRLCACV